MSRTNTRLKEPLETENKLTPRDPKASSDLPNSLIDPNAGLKQLLDLIADVFVAEDVAREAKYE
jgi:hypothetical protein